MGAIFGKKPKSPNVTSKITENDRVILRLKQQRDKIKQYQKRINLQLENEREIVRKLVQDNKKERALLLLRKKKFMESLLEKSDNQLLNIEQMVQTIEFKEMEIDIVERLKTGNDALKKLNEALDIERIEDILEETKEGAEKQKEISRLFANQAGDQLQENEEDLLKELDELVTKDNIIEKLPEVNKDTIETKLPDVSKDAIEVEPEEYKTQQAKKSTKNNKILVEIS